MKNEQLLTETIAKTLIIQTLVQSLNANDRHDWALARSLWTDELTIDFGGVKETQILKADDLIAWAKIAYREMETMHMSFNHEVTVNEDKASSYSYGRALHRQQVSAGEDYWFIYARYEHDYIKVNDGWKISRIKMTPVFQEGNSNIVNQAYADAMSKQ